MKRLAVAVLAGLLVFVLGLLVRPATPSPGEAEGDPALIEAVRDQDLPGHRLAVIVIDGDRERSAYFDGATPRTRYELGSFTKAVTGLLLADGARRGELALDDELGAHLDVGTGPASQVTLQQLATHTSGLPRLNTGLADLPRALWALLAARNPYTGTPQDLLADTATITPGEQTFAYSNLGAALTGYAAASAAGMAYPDLVRERVLDPLALQDTAVQNHEPLVEPGTDAAGRHQQPWVMDGMAPAGAMVSTPADVRALTRAVLDGSAPGPTALEPAARIGPGEQIGLFWFVDDYPGGAGSYAWHNGTTGGYTSFVGVDRDRQRAVIVLNATSEGAAALGHALLTDPRTWG